MEVAHSLLLTLDIDSSHAWCGGLRQQSAPCSLCWPFVGRSGGARKFHHWVHHTVYRTGWIQTSIMQINGNCKGINIISLGSAEPNAYVLPPPLVGRRERHRVAASIVRVEDFGPVRSGWCLAMVMIPVWCCWHGVVLLTTT
jgi:hypothetical protein